MAAAEADYHAALEQLTVFLDRVAVLFDDGFDDLQAAVDVWLTLRVGRPAFSSFISAIAIVQLAKGHRQRARDPTDSTPQRIIAAEGDRGAASPCEST